MGDDKLAIGVGSKEPKKLEPKAVIVKEISVAMQKDKDKKDVGDKVVFKVLHPDKAELIEISSIKFEKDNKMKVVGSWFQLDEDGLLAKNSAVSIMLRFYGKNTLNDLINSSVQTTLDENKYLCFKAY